MSQWNFDANHVVSMVINQQSCNIRKKLSKNDDSSQCALHNTCKYQVFRTDNLSLTIKSKQLWNLLYSNVVLNSMQTPIDPKVMCG